MANYVSIRGFVSSDFQMHTSPTGTVIGKFRMGSTERRQDPITNLWVDGRTNWYHISVFRALAQNAVSSLHKGDNILVMGKLRINSFLRKDGTEGTSVEIEADSVGPDLRYGTAHYARTVSARPAEQSTGQSDYWHDGDPSADGKDVSTTPDADQDGADRSGGADGSDSALQEGGDFDGGNQDVQADDDGLDDDEYADQETGEVVKEAAPF